LRFVRDWRTRNWPICSASRRTTWPSGCTASGCGCRQRSTVEHDRHGGPRCPKTDWIVHCKG
jgi:hypothetical protein